MVTTRKQPYGEGVESEQTTEAPIYKYDDLRQYYSFSLQQRQYQPIISSVLDGELPKYQGSKVIDVRNRVPLMAECALILSSASSVFAAAVKGDLASRMLTDTKLRSEYDLLADRARSQPSIYIHLLVDEQGVPPTPDQYMVVRDIVLDYIAKGKSQYTAQIDSITPYNKKGPCKYLRTDAKPRSPAHVQVLQRFCDGVEKRCLDIDPVLRDTPLKYPPGECGYAKDSHKRIEQHRKHQSSNYIMNLVEDICTHLHRTQQFKQHFSMHAFIIYPIFKPQQASIAEIFCSGLLQTWVENGGGFNSYRAGVSVDSKNRVTTGEWSTHEQWVRQTSPIERNMALQAEMAEEWSAALNCEDAQGEIEDVEMEDDSEEVGQE